MDGVIIDISLVMCGNNVFGCNDGGGYLVNFVIGEFYMLQNVLVGDFFWVIVEFWVDGLDLEMFFGYWFFIVNDFVNDSLFFECCIGGVGFEFDLLEWDVKFYFVFGGVMYDVVIVVWSVKGYYDYI